MMNPCLKWQKALTLVELLVTIAFVGIISSIGLPAYRSLINTIKVSVVTSQLHASLLFSRAEAIKRGRSVSICRSNNADSLSPTCATTTSNPRVNTGWGEGWLIYVDVDNDKVYSSSDILLQAQGSLIPTLGAGSIVPVPNRNAVTFNVTGQTFGTFMRFVISRPDDDLDLSHDRFICIASGGRARVASALCGLV